MGEKMDHASETPTTLEQLESGVDHLLERMSQLQQEKETLQTTLQHVQRQKNLSAEKQQHAQEKLRKIITTLREQLSRDEVLASHSPSVPMSEAPTDLDDFLSDEAEGAPA